MLTNVIRYFNTLHPEVIMRKKEYHGKQIPGTRYAIGKQHQAKYYTLITKPVNAPACRKSNQKIGSIRGGVYKR
jgi:hypothetical protein